MISVIYEKEDKKTAISISKELEAKGFECNINNVSAILSKEKEKINEIELAILVFSKKSNVSEKIMKQYDIIFNNDIELIPFVVSDVELSIAMQHFLDSHDWINAYDINQNDAIKDLGILVNELLNESNGTKKLQNKKTGQKSEAKNTKTYLALGIGIVVVIFALVYFLGNNDATSPVKSDSGQKATIVGTWLLADYSDNLPREPQAYAEFLSNVATLKQNFKLVINEDETFEKLGFSVPEYGNWKFDNQNMVLYMWPQGSSPQSKDLLQVEKLTPDSLIMSVASKLDSTTQVITRFSMYRTDK